MHWYQLLTEAMKFNKIILASGSPRRRELLMQIGMKFDVIVSQVDEIVKSTVPAKVVEELSCQKAMAVYEELKSELSDCEHSLVIGSDTVVSVDGKILGKPRDEKHAYEMIAMIAGRQHSVFTGVTLIVDGKAYSFYEETKVYVYSMKDSEINEYIATKEPMDKAGAYGIQGKFAAYVKGIEGDYNNVVGLPVGRICEELRKMKFEI